MKPLLHKILAHPYSAIYSRLFISSLLLGGASSKAFSTEFSRGFLHTPKAGDSVDIGFFEKDSDILPGLYNIDILLNNVFWKRQDVLFIASTPEKKVKPQISLNMLRQMGVNLLRLERDGLLKPRMDDSAPLDIASIIPGATVDFDISELSLQISLPQIYVVNTSRSHIDSSLWDDGITAFYSNYQSTFSRNTSKSSRSDYGYIGLRNGFNIRSWQLRNESSINKRNGTGTRIQSTRSYISRNLPALKGRLSLGELFTSGDSFDSVRFQGMQIGSDIGMLPDNEIGYAPTIRGIAESNATVEVSQNGYVIYSTNVSPGAFEITDIYPNGSNGDFTITIIEADGRKRQYTQSFSFLPIMVRKGGLRYNLANGKYDSEGQSSLRFTQGSVIYGLTDNITTFGGLRNARNYQASNLGLGINTVLGGISFDVTDTRSKTQSGKSSGRSMRLLYSKTVSRTNTTFTMTGYRYSTEGYRSLSQHMQDLELLSSSLRGLQKSQLDLNINQTFGNHGSLFLSMGESSYWNAAARTRRYQIGYSGSLFDASYNLTASQTETMGISDSRDTQFSVSVSLPIGRSSRAPRLYASATSSRHGDSSVQSGVSGYLNEKSTLSYSAQTNYSKESRSSGSLGLGWDTRYASISGNYSQAQSSQHYDLNATGVVVAHGEGVTFGQQAGETFALVEVPGVRDVGLDSSTSIRTDSAGYAVANFIQPYRRNWLGLNTADLDSDIELRETSQQVIPSRGAIVLAIFDAETGRRVQFDLSLEGGGSIPFGAIVHDQDGNRLGVVDNLSRLLAFGVKDSGKLDVKWSGGGCHLEYALPERKEGTHYDLVKVTCLPRDQNLNRENT